MQIIEVIPLAILPPQVPQLLSYYFNKPLIKGAIVEVLIGNRKILAAVISCASVEEQKISLKKSDFQLKKISGIISESPLVSDIQFKIALWLSKNYFTSLGLCLKTVLPPFFLKKNYELRMMNDESKNSAFRIQHSEFKPLMLLSRAKYIIKNIQPEIKKILNQKKQVLIIVPEISIAQYFYDYFAGYYETALVHSKIGLKQYCQFWEKISSGDTEVIIGARQALFAPFANLGLIIIEDPANSAYKSDRSPKYNTDELALKIADIYECNVVYVAQIPDMKRYYLADEKLDKVEDKILLPSSKIKVIDMIQELRSGNHYILGLEFTDRLSEYIKRKKKILIFSSRKGYSGSFVCENCGFNFKCPNCSVSLRPYKMPESFLICHRCSKVQKPSESCPNCHSYKLKTAGFPGSQRLEEELKHQLSNWQLDAPIFILDSGMIKTAKAEKEILKKMENAESYICIATQMIFSYRYNRQFDLIGIANIDGLTTMPDFRSEEELFLQFYKILDFQPEEILIQTYNADSPAISLLTAGNYQEFYKRELPARKLFWYPPFVRLIKLSLRHHDPQKAAYEARILGEKLKMAISQRKLDQSVRILGPSPAFVPKERGLYIYNIALKIVPTQKPDEILRFVPSNWSIDVDPRSLL